MPRPAKKTNRSKKTRHTKSVYAQCKDTLQKQVKRLPQTNEGQQAELALWYLERLPEDLKDKTTGGADRRFALAQQKKVLYSYMSENPADNAPAPAASIPAAAGSASGGGEDDDEETESDGTSSQLSTSGEAPREITRDGGVTSARWRSSPHPGSQGEEMAMEVDSEDDLSLQGPPARGHTAFPPPASGANDSDRDADGASADDAEDDTPEKQAEEERLAGIQEELKEFFGDSDESGDEDARGAAARNLWSTGEEETKEATVAATAAAAEGGFGQGNEATATMEEVQAAEAAKEAEGAKRKRKKSRTDLWPQPLPGPELLAAVMTATSGALCSDDAQNALFHAGVLSIMEDGARLVRLKEHQLEALGDDGVLRVLQLAAEAACVVLLKGYGAQLDVLLKKDEEQQRGATRGEAAESEVIAAEPHGLSDTHMRLIDDALTRWLDRRGHFDAELSGPTTEVGSSAAARSTTLQEYRNSASEHKHNLPIFNLNSAKSQATELLILKTHPVLKYLLPFHPHGGLEQHTNFKDECRWGPFTFGGYVNVKEIAGEDKRLAWKFSGSSLHLDANGGCSAAGIVRLGKKSVTFVEAEHCELALIKARSELEGQMGAHLPFKPYGKASGSRTTCNPPVTSAVRRRWTRDGVRYGIMEVDAGDFYYLPAGVLHEFRNVTSVISTAWDLLPPPGVRSAEALKRMQSSIAQLKLDLKKQPDRIAALNDSPPDAALMQRAGEVHVALATAEPSSRM